MPEPSRPQVPDLGKIIHELEPSAAFQVSPPMQTNAPPSADGAPTPAEVRTEVERLYYAHLPAVVLTSYQTIEEGDISEFGTEGFRIGARGHWVWWAQVERVGEKQR